MARYRGLKLQLYCSTTAAGAAVPVIGITNWTFDASTDKSEATGSGDTNKIQVSGLPNANGTFAFNWDDTDDTLFDAADGGEACRMYLYKDAANAPTIYRYGSAYIDIADDVPFAGTVAGSGSFSASGVWARKP